MSAGGCHLNEEPFEKNLNKRTWTSNPKFFIQFKEPGPIKVKLTLQVADKNWKSKIAKENKVQTASGMIGIYLLEKREGKIRTADRLADPTFVPMLEVVETFELKNINPNGYVVMPATYEVSNMIILILA